MIIGDIIPFASVGDVKLGMAREEVRARVGGSIREATKGGADVDQFLESNVLSYYNEEGECICLEFYVSEEQRAIYPAINNQVLLGRPYSVVLRAIEEADVNISLDSSGFTSQLFGIGVYIAGPEDDPLVDGVAVYSSEALP